jgi:hypothetical protein
MEAEAGLAEWQRETKELLDRQERALVNEQEAVLREWERQQREKEEIWQAKTKQLERKRLMKQQKPREDKSERGGEQRDVETNQHQGQQQHTLTAPIPPREAAQRTCKTCGGNHMYCVGTSYSFSEGGRRQLTRTNALRNRGAFQASGCSGQLEGCLEATASDDDVARTGCGARTYPDGATDASLKSSYEQEAANYLHHLGGLIRGFMTFSYGIALQQACLCLPVFGKVGLTSSRPSEAAISAERGSVS